MTSSHRYFKSAVGVVFKSYLQQSQLRPHMSPLHPVADRSVNIDSLVDDFVTFYVAGTTISIVIDYFRPCDPNPQVRRPQQTHYHLQSSLFISILKCLIGVFCGLISICT